MSNALLDQARNMRGESVELIIVQRKPDQSIRSLMLLLYPGLELGNANEINRGIVEGLATKTREWDVERDLYPVS